MSLNDYNTDVAGTTVDMPELYRGLAKILKSDIEVPEYKMKLAQKDEDGNWVFLENAVAKLWYPGGDTQTCFAEVTLPKELGNGDVVPHTKYMQIEYHEIPTAIRAHSDAMRELGYEIVIVQINNYQLRQWITECGLMEMSESIIQQMQDENIRNKRNGGVEQKQERANNNASRKNGD